MMKMCFRLLIVIALLGSAAHAQTLEPSQRVLYGRSVYGPYVPIGLWIPIMLDFRNETDQDIVSSAYLPIIDASAGAQIEEPVRIPARSRVERLTYWFMPPTAPNGAPWSQTTGALPLLVAEWRDPSGALLSFAEISGRPSDEAPGADLPADKPPTFFLSIDDELDSEIAYDSQSFARDIQRLTGRQILPQVLSSEEAPRDLRGYAPCRFVAINYANLDRLDLAQRHAMLQFVRQGGNLIIPAPRGEMDWSDSWISPYMPVQIIGQRLTDRVTLSDGSVIRCVSYVHLTEATDRFAPDAQQAPDRIIRVVLRDKDDFYIHAAYTELGLGRIIFTSLPIRALDSKDPNTYRIWRQLLNFQSPPTQIEATGLAQDQMREKILQTMMGRSTIPWSTAAMVCAAFFVVAVGVQLLVGGTRRPAAFLLTTIIAVVLSLGLVGLAMLRTSAETPQGAQLSIMQVLPQGGGSQRDVVAYMGQNRDDFALTGAAGDELIRPIVTRRGDRPVIRVHPPSAPTAGMHALKIERVWEASGALGEDYRASATAEFTEQGLTLNVDNGFGQPLAAGVLVWDGVRFSVPDLPVGSTQVPVRDRNPVDEYGNTLAAFRSQMAHLRASVLRELLTRTSTDQMLIPHQPEAFLATYLDGEAPALLKSSMELPVRSLAMVQLPIAVVPPKVGDRIRIDPPFTRITSSRSGLGNYNPVERQWLSTNLPMQLLVGFAPPPQVGRLKPLNVTIELEASAPQQTITFRRGQAPGGKTPLDVNLNGPIVGQPISRPLGLQRIEFEAGPGDYDADGVVWLCVDVDSPLAAGGQVVAQWQFMRLEVGMTAQVEAPADPLGPPIERHLGGLNDGDDE